MKKALAPKPRVTNQPAIQPDEAHKMLAIIKNTSGRKIIKIYTELLAHLFTRPSELRLAQWSEFNLQQAEWHIPAERMKMTAPHWVPLPPRALELLKELRLDSGFTPYLFNSPAAKTPKPISETSARKLLHNNGYKDLHTLHGFRALASTVLHEQGHFRSDAIEAQLAHKVQGVRGVYLRADFKHERRLLMEWYSNWLLRNQKEFRFAIIMNHVGQLNPEETLIYQNVKNNLIYPTRTLPKNNHYIDKVLCFGKKAYENYMDTIQCNIVSESIHK